MESMEELTKAAYAMSAAYDRESILGDAVHSVAEQFPELDTSGGILRAMWMAIDAHADLNSN